MDLFRYLPEQTVTIMNIPKDPIILLSFINTKLRDEYPTLDDLSKSLMLDRSQLENTLSSIGYQYNIEQNRFMEEHS